MKEVNKIISHPDFLGEMKKLQVLEQDRSFCRHGIDHLMAVARIAWIRVLEEELPLKKETVYAAALLHDIGRAAQYETGEPHDEAGERIAGRILEDIAFPEEERETILTAIKGHRKKEGEKDILGELLYTADKRSRDCFFCPAEPECNWASEKKNRTIDW